MTLDQIIARIEEIKSKGLRLSLADTHELIDLYDRLWVIEIESDSMYIEEKNEVDNKKAIKYEELKAETIEVEDAKWNPKTKNVYTDEWCKSMIKQLFQDEDKALAVMRATIKMSGHKKWVCQEYIHLSKIVVK